MKSNPTITVFSDRASAIACGSRLSPLFLALALVLLAKGAGLAVCTTSVRGGPWFAPATWSAGVPAAGDSAVISNCWVTFDATNVDAIVSLANLSFEPEGTLTLDRGILQLTGEDSLWIKGGFSGGDLLLSGRLTLASTNDKAAGVLTNAGSIMHRDTGALNLYSAVFLHNAATGQYDLQDDGNLLGHPDIYGRPIFVNRGNFRKSGGAGESVVQNLRFHNLNGKVEVLSGRLRLSGGGTSTDGFLSVAQGTLLDLTSFGQTHFWQGRLVGTGEGQILFAGGELTSSGALALSFPSNLFHWSGGTITGPVTNELSITLDGTNSLQLAETLFNWDHLLHLGDSNLTFIGGAILENTPGAAYTLDGDGNFDWTKDWAFAANGRFHNEGLFQKRGGRGASRFTEVIFDNLDGTVLVDSGTLALTFGGSSSNGTFVVAANALLDLSCPGRTHMWQGRVVGTGEGQILFTAGALISSGGLALSFPSNLFHWDGGRITGPITNELSITLDGTNSVQLTEMLFNWEHMLHLGPSNLTFVGGAILKNTPGATYTLDGDGNFDWTKDWAFAGNGKFHNRGLFQKRGGSGISRFTGVGFENQDGTVVVDTGTLALAFGGSSSNGTFGVAANALLDLSCPGRTHTWQGRVVGTGEGQILLGAGELISSGALTLGFSSNLFHWNGGAITGPLTNEMSITLDGAASVRLADMLFNGGHVLHYGSSNLTFVNGAVVENLQDAAYTLTGDGGFDWLKGGPFAGHGRFRNQGLLHKTGGSGVSRFTGVGFENLGGIVVVDSGTLALTFGGIGIDGAFTVESGAVLDLSCSGASHAWGGRMVGKGTGQILLTDGAINSDGTLALSFPSNLFHWNGGRITGPLTNEVTINLDGTNSVQLADTLFNRGHLLHCGASNLSFDGSAVLNNETAATYTLAGDGGFDWIYEQWAANGRFRNAGLFQKTGGAGVSRLTGVAFDNLDGTVAVNSGTLALTFGGTSANGRFNVMSGAVLDLSCPGKAHVWQGRIVGTGAGLILLTAGYLSSAGNLALSCPSNLFHWNGGRITGPLTNEASLTLDGTNQVQLAETLVNCGQLLHYGPSNLNLVGSAVFENRSGAVYTLAGDGGLDWTYEQWAGKGIFRNQGVLQKTGGSGGSRFTNVGVQNQGGSVEARSGTLCFDYAYTQTDGTTTLAGGAIAASVLLDIQGGSVLGSGDIAADLKSAGKLSPGNSIGRINILSNYTQTASGALQIEIAGRMADQFDQLNIGQKASLGGTLSLVLTNGWVPAAGDLIPILTCAERSGTFATITGLPPGGGLMVEYRTNGVFLAASGSVPEITLSSPGISGTNFVFSLSTVMGRDYTVQATPDLGSSDWTDLLAISGDGTVRQISLPLLDLHHRFFRVLVE